MTNIDPRLERIAEICIEGNLSAISIQKILKHLGTDHAEAVEMRTKAIIIDCSFIKQSRTLFETKYKSKLNTIRIYSDNDKDLFYYYSNIVYYILNDWKCRSCLQGKQSQSRKERKLSKDTYFAAIGHDHNTLNRCLCNVDYIENVMLWSEMKDPDRADKLRKIVNLIKKDLKNILIPSIV